MDTNAIFGWLDLLDNLDYYELLKVDRSATTDDVKRAFHEFAESFHPDGHPGRTPDERIALDTIFKRGTEAYAVLSNPAARAAYEGQLDGAALDAPPRMRTVPPNATSAASGRASQAPPKLEDKARSASARPFARRAEELVERGDLRQAKLQMVMANHHDPENAALQSYLRHIEDELKKR